MAHWQNYSYEAATNINLWLVIHKTTENMCFPMVKTHRLITPAV